ncbi:MAG: hypothetical protein WBG90_04895 [Saonia sp.]
MKNSKLFVYRNLNFKYILFIVCINCFLVNAQFSGGTGTSENPYQIADLNDLKSLSENPEDWGKHFILTNHIDASDTRSWNGTLGFSPIGDNLNGGYRQAVFFMGSFDGQGYTITDLYINRPDEGYVGLFGAVQEARIANIGLSTVTINGGDFCGGLIGLNMESYTSNCYVTGTVTGKVNSGGLIGINESSPIHNSYTNTQISGSNTGGLVGLNITSDINNCYAAGLVNGSSIAGGLIGYHLSGTVNYCYAMGRTNGNTAGGLIGGNNGFISHSYYDMDTTTQSVGIGIDNTAQNVTGLATAGFDTDTLFKNDGWDFLDIWEIGTDITIDPNTRPYLKMQLYEHQISVSILPEIGGSVTGTSYYNKNQTVTLILQAQPNYSFVGWELNGTMVSTANPYTFTCTGNQSYTAILTENVSVAFAGGTGIKTDPYQIATIEQLNAIHEIPTLLNRHYELVADIDASDTKNWNGGEGFIPIGYHHSEEDFGHFTGSFNGNEHTISNLYINRPNEDHVGLFGYSNRSVLSKVGFINCDIRGKNNVGALVGYHIGYGDSNFFSINQCYANGTISGTDLIGGLIGNSYTANISTCYSTARVVGNNNVGGLVGFSQGLIGTIATIEHSYAAGPVIANGPSGAIVASIPNATVRNSCYDFQTTTLDKGTNVGDLRGTTPIRTNNFTDPFYVEGLSGFDVVNDWQYAYGHDGYKRPLLKWEKVYAINLDTDGNGTIEGNPIQNAVHGSDAGPFITYPNEGYKFAAWQDENNNDISIDNPLTINSVIKDYELTAVFHTATGSYSMTLTVTDGTNPIADAVIIFDDNYYKTDVNGAVIITKLDPGTYSYKITANDFQDVNDTITITNTDVGKNITMAAVPIIFTSATFNVKDGPIPIANAQIAIQNIAPPYQTTNLTTDANGKVTANNLPGASLRYTISANGFKDVKGEYTLIIGKRTINISMKTVHEVRLTVTDGTDPVPNATISFDSVNYTTDGTGTVVINDIVPGSYAYTVTANGFLSVLKTISVTDMDVGDTVVLVPPTDPVHEVTLRITDGTNPIPGAVVIFDLIIFY